MHDDRQTTSIVLTNKGLHTLLNNACPSYTCIVLANKLQKYIGTVQQ